jgi:small multidrug resistance pump
MMYLWLGLAIMFEVGWAIAMKLSLGFTRPLPTVATIIMYLLSVVFLAQVTKRMDVGVAYATWAGAGVALIAIAGMTYFREPVAAIKIVSLLLIVTGIVGLHVSNGGHAATPQVPLTR